MEGNNHAEDEEAVCYQVLQVIASALGDTSDIDSDDNDDDIESEAEVNEEELIAGKNEDEREFIQKHRTLFSENLSPDRYLYSKPMRIMLKDIRSKWDERLYRYKPRPVPLGIKDKAKKLPEA